MENKVDSILDTAFGVNTEPTWDDFLIFLESRCIPRTRCGLNYYLDAVGVSEYDPIQLVEKTHGRMAEDHKWLRSPDPPHPLKYQRQFSVYRKLPLSVLG